jgi:hypothetical protein
MSANAKDKISRLHGLLERVQARASSPRSSGVMSTSGGGAADPDAEVMSAAPVTPHVASSHPTAPPVSDDAYDYESDVEVSSEVVEVDIDVDEPAALESGAQPVAQQTIPPEDLEEELEESPIATQPSAPPAELEEVEQPANEIEEPAPSSSRRPIAAEAASAEAYEAESAPRHTPPPESGRQVAAAPSTHPPPRKSSSPPPSLEGHTLIGGWREPGLGGPQVGVGFGAGVRVPGPGPAAGRPAGPTGTEPSSPVARPPVAPAQGSGPRLTADVTNPDLAASGEHVVAFEGAPAVPRPKTLGDLLDMTLGL